MTARSLCHPQCTAMKEYTFPILCTLHRQLFQAKLWHLEFVPQSSKNITIVNNTIRQNGSDGIAFRSAANCTTFSLLIANNRIYNNERHPHIPTDIWDKMVVIAQQIELNNTSDN